MKTNIATLRSFVGLAARRQSRLALVLLAALLNACTGPHVRMYDGPDRADDQVVRINCPSGIHIIEVDGKRTGCRMAHAIMDRVRLAHITFPSPHESGLVRIR